MYNADKPIKSSSEDLLGRSEFARKLAEAIIKLSSTDTFIAGLYGEWGSGKTSVLNITVETLISLSGVDGNPEVTVIRFNPWGYTDGNQLVQQFFSCLRTELIDNTGDERKKVLGEALEKYSFALDYLKYIPVVGQFLSGIPEFSKIIGTQLKDNILSKENNVQFQKEKVRNALLSFNKRIIIIIDDIDRLPNDQIRMVFQLVNSVADFPNVVYILSFDKTIVCRALATEQDCRGEDYLRKIIQLPFLLPDVESAKLHDVFFMEIDSLFSEVDEALFDYAHWQNVFTNCVRPFLFSLRDVYRLINVLTFKIVPLSNSTRPSDLVGIVSLEVFAPDLFEWIRFNKVLLTVDNTKELKKGTRTDTNRKEWLGKLQEISILDPETSLHALITLFPVFACSVFQTQVIPSISELGLLNSIGSYERFDNYFIFKIGCYLLTTSRITQSYRVLRNDELVKYLCEIDSTNHLNEYLEHTLSSLEKIPDSRILMFILSVFQCLIKRTINPNKSFSFAITSEQYLLNIILGLLRNVKNETTRVEIATTLLEEFSKIDPYSCFGLMEALERSHGRFNDPHQTLSTALFSDFGLAYIERIYFKHLHEALINTTLLETPAFINASQIWMAIDRDSYFTYMKSLLTQKESILLFAASMVKRAFHSVLGRGWAVEIRDDFRLLVSIEETIDLISALLNGNKASTFDEETQCRLAAFILFFQKSKNPHEIVSDNEISDLFSEWQS